MTPTAAVSTLEHALQQVFGVWPLPAGQQQRHREQARRRGIDEILKGSNRLL
jgi:hypothetical protein